MEQTGRRKPNGMATASLVLGIFAILSILNVYYALFLGSMSILLACLSRGDSYKMPEKAIGGFATSTFAIVISVLLTAFSMYLMLEMFGLETLLDPEALQEAITNLYSNLLNEMQMDLQTGGAAL